ncbi:hypothetical protein IIY66_02975, partial [Candidatus Saccharibacteria bacterium]|nr:hypothetical protein [Candidatus Saccharibacteria bacterium]
KHLITGIASTLSLATILGVGIYSATNIVNTNNVNALSYSTNEDISFTFKPTLSISLSTGALTIDNLVPGTTSDSNAVTVTVASNTPYGYVLSAGVGSTVSTDPYYNTSDLVHDNTTTQVPTTNKFSSISTTASLESLNTDNTWGYSTSTDGGTNWSTYSGLSHTETKPLLDISDPAQPSTIDFKIAARSASTQASGTYNNVITFYAVGKPKPLAIDDLTYLQDFASLSDADKQAMIAATPTEVTYILKDKRDDQDYTVAKLRDGKIWMTKNLNLAGGSVITSELSDVPDDYTLPVANNFQSGNKLPNSDTWGFNNDTKAFVYNSPKATGADCSPPGCYSYYSWTAATVGSGLNISTDGTDAPYSICPKGWKLPNSRATSSSDWQSADFYQLAIAYGMDSSDTSQSTTNFYSQAGPGTVPNFMLAGYYYGSSFTSGNMGQYWASSSRYAANARGLFFSSAFVNSARVDDRRYGDSIRCLAK